ncbi:MAG: hypothetical protein M3Q71_10680 [Chloroflexota bacterium]|nr:hypothetical protein [Chloroflexota bacterium]MDP9471113.1 hypothetical protein [Chloroflexota bacterium]
MSLDPERKPMVCPVFAWLEIAGRLAALGDGALAADIQQAMNGRRLGDDAPFDVTDDERARVQAVIVE